MFFSLFELESIHTAGGALALGAAGASAQ